MMKLVCTTTILGIVQLDASHDHASLPRLRSQTRFHSTRWPLKSNEKMSLGYDWIAGLLDESVAIGHGDAADSHYEELREFRRINREECSDLLAQHSLCTSVFLP